MGGRHHYWIKVRARSDGREGFVYGKYLTRIDDSQSSSEPASAVETEAYSYVSSAGPESSQLPTGRRFVIGISVDDYSETQNASGIRDLTYAGQSVKLVARSLSSDSLYLISDEDANPKKIMSLTERVGAEMNKNDLMVFIYSGHGQRTKLNTHSQDLYLENYMKNLSKYSGHKLLVLDACYSGEVTEEMNKIMRQGNISLMASSKGDQVSYQAGKLHLAVFLNYVNLGLNGAADTNRDKKISYGELKTYVHCT